MKGNILNFGSLNIDHVYRVEHIAVSGETVPCFSYKRFAGGKGANQSVAIARAGGRVEHIGKVGREGQWIKQGMEKDGVDTSRIEVSDQPGGHAIIQVDDEGQNSIVIYGGTNRDITEDQIDRALSRNREGDFVLLQNEINNIPYIMKRAASLEMSIYFNAAPMSSEVMSYPLELVHTFFINETEGEAMTQRTGEQEIIKEMLRLFPRSRVVLTLGSKGLLYGDAETTIRREAERDVDPVDTTGAGDTFVGYYVATLAREGDVSESLIMANLAASFCVTKAGASDSIPLLSELDGF